LSAEGAQAIGFDILFRELHPPSPETALTISNQTINSDDYFAAQLRRTSNVVLAVIEGRNRRRLESLASGGQVSHQRLDARHINSHVDPDGVLRRARPITMTGVRADLAYGDRARGSALNFNLNQRIHQLRKDRVAGSRGRGKDHPCRQQRLLLY